MTLMGRATKSEANRSVESWPFLSAFFSFAMSSNNQGTTSGMSRVGDALTAHFVFCLIGAARFLSLSLSHTHADHTQNAAKTDTQQQAVNSHQVLPSSFRAHRTT